jgi:creatinine amidohydrolase
MPLAMNLSPSTLTAVVADLVESIELAGIRKALLLNSHGGNECKAILRELIGKTQVHLFLCDWYNSFGDRYDEIFENSEDHAGEMETSFALAYFPELVGRNADGSFVADEGRARPLRFEAMRQGWVTITRPWHLLTTNAGSGNPHAATAEKGRKMVEILVERLSTFLVELSAAEIDPWFPFEPS